MTVELHALPSGDGEDPRWIYDRYHSRVLRFALRRFGPRDAEDIAAETLARCYAHARRIDLGRDLWPWLCTVAHRVGCDIARARLRDLPVPDETLDTLRGTARDASEEVVTREEWRILRQAFDLLSPADRLILRLREVEEQGFDTIGELLGTTANAARQRLFRARTRLARAYGELGGRVRGILVAVFTGRAPRRADPRTQEYASLLASPVVYCLTWAATVVVGAGVLGAAGGSGTGDRSSAATRGRVALSAGWIPRDGERALTDRRLPAPRAARHGTGDGTTRIEADAGPARVRSKVRDPRKLRHNGESDRSRIEIDTPLGPFYVETWGDNPESDDPSVVCYVTGSVDCDR